VSADSAAPPPADDQTSSGIREAGISQTLERGITILEVLASHADLKIADLARITGVHRSNIHRLVRSLENHRLVTRSATGTYSLGHGLALLAARTKTDLRAVTRPTMEAIARGTGETVHLAMLNGPDIVYVEAVESNQPVRVASRTGTVFPAHATSVGKAMLATLDVAQIRQLYPRNALPQYTEDTLRRRSDLEAELEKIRLTGYGTNAGESTQGMASIGVALVNRIGVVQAGISVSAPIDRFGAEQEAEAARITRAAAARLTDAL
jgi:IclR family acetate operon transcriptional repressor